jgi:hypothetical protein
MKKGRLLSKRSMRLPVTNDAVWHVCLGMGIVVFRIDGIRMKSHWNVGCGRWKERLFGGETGCERYIEKGLKISIRAEKYDGFGNSARMNG